MKVKLMSVAVIASLLIAGSAMAWMTGGMGGSMGWYGGGGTGAGYSCLGPGYGMGGTGGMMSYMFNGTMSQGFLEILTPIATPDEAVAAIEAFFGAARSNLQISEIWEYETAYKAEISDTNGQRAFDILADKLTGTVMPEMGFSMMMNASYGSALQRTPRFSQTLRLTPDSATAAARAFINRNSADLDYTLAAPEIYPGYYKFHTTDSLGNPEIDIMVNGYSGYIWMNTQMGAPIERVF